jgi:hypothetical protein
MKHKTAQDIIDAFDTRAQLAHAMGETANTVRKWHESNRIPPRYWRALMRLVPGLTLKHLLAMEEASITEAETKKERRAMAARRKSTARAKAKPKKTAAKRRPASRKTAVRKKVTSKTPARARKKKPTAAEPAAETPAAVPSEAPIGDASGEVAPV